MVKGNSFSTRGEPQVAQLLDTEIDFSTLTAGDVLTWEATEQVWINAAGGGGGGGIVGTDDDALFKQGGNANTFTNGITRDPTLTGRALTLNTTNLRCGIGGSSNAVNMVNTLEVFGGVRIKAPVGSNEIVIDGDNIGNIIGGSVLRLYSSNSIVPEDIVVVDSFNRLCTVGGTLVTLPPTAFDTPNGTQEDGIYKIKLSLGMNIAVAVAPFDAQNPLSGATTAFPTGQVIEYQNNKPIQDWAIISRLANNATLTPAVPYVFTNFGTFSAFTDRLIYDPMGCRTRLAAGVQWQFAGAPSVQRVAGNEFMINCKWYVDGLWGLADPANQLDIYVTQYRSAVLFRQFLVSTQGSPSAPFHTSGERTFMGFAPYGEDFNCLTDDYQCEMVNFGANTFTIGTTQCEFRFILAQ